MAPWYSIPLKDKGIALRPILDLKKGEIVGGRRNKAIEKGFLEVLSLEFSAHQEDKNCAFMSL